MNHRRRRSDDQYANVSGKKLTNMLLNDRSRDVSLIQKLDLIRTWNASQVLEDHMFG